MQHLYNEDPDYYAERAEGLLASARDGTPGALAAFARHAAPISEDGARSVVAGEHGLASWSALLLAVGALRTSGDPFAAAYRAVEAHDLEALTGCLDRAPELAHARGTNGNDLLGMAAATWDERTVGLLLDRGADPASANAHGSTPLHQAGYSDLPLLAELLLDWGAPVTAQARGVGGTPLVMALFWGNRTVAELLAGRGGHVPDNLRVAAGLGDTGRIGALLAAGVPSGHAQEPCPPDAAPGAARAFYRPHAGFPAWAPSDDRQEVLDEALAWAARNDRADALEVLVAAGARVEADVYRGTALMWAAATGADAAVQRLIDLGADPNGRSTFGGPEHGEDATPLHLAAQSGMVQTVRLLLALGADRTLCDALYDSPPAGWAEHGGQQAIARELRA